MYKTRALISAAIWAILPNPALYKTSLKLYNNTRSNTGNILMRMFPSKRYIEFRLYTQYGDKQPSKEVLKTDMIHYIKWVKNYK